MTSRAFVVAILVLAGCRPPAPVVLPDVEAQEPQASTPQFEAMLLAATEATRAVPDVITRTHFNATLRERVRKDLAGTLDRLVAALTRKPEFAYKPPALYGSTPGRDGWRLLGLALTWRAQARFDEGRFDAALDDIVAVHRFGLWLTNGDAADVTLGCSLIDAGRRVALQRVPDLGAGQLAKLAERLADVLGTPSLESAARNERARMLVALAGLQNSFEQRSFGEILRRLRDDAYAVEKTFNQLVKAPADEQIAFFRGLRAEVDEQVETLRARPEPAMSGGERPRRAWSTISRHFFGGACAVRQSYWRTISRTRMFALTCELYRLRKAAVPLPSDLSRFDRRLGVDPFSGGPFVYQAASGEFRLYSVGDDGADDGGETDEQGLAPDLTLEPS